MIIIVYSLDSLLKEYRQGKKYEFLFFFGVGKNNKFGWLSQWYKKRFCVDNVMYTCAEQYMMAQKAKLFNDIIILEQIMLASSSYEIKKLGKAVHNFDENIWKENRCEIVKKGNMAKFIQNKILLKALLTTDDCILVEASPYDKIWGIGMSEYNVNANDPTKWRGQNLLGFALTEVREEIKEKGGSL